MVGGNEFNSDVNDAAVVTFRGKLMSTPVITAKFKSKKSLSPSIERNGARPSALLFDPKSPTHSDQKIDLEMANKQNNRLKGGAKRIVRGKDLCNKSPSEIADQELEIGSPTSLANLNRLTLTNTRANSEYQNCDIKVEIVKVNQPRPPSPSMQFSKKGNDGRKDLTLLSSDEESIANLATARRRLVWGKSLVHDGEPSQINEPLDPFITIPTKPCLKKKLETCTSTYHPVKSIDAKQEEKKTTITVRKLVYKDDELYKKLDRADGIFGKKNKKLEKKHEPGGRCNGKNNNECNDRGVQKKLGNGTGPQRLVRKSH